MVDARKGISASLVGTQPDTNTQYGASGSRGINQIGDDPYRMNNMVPGAGSDVNATGFGEADSFSMFEQDLDAVNQALEMSFDDTDEGMSEQEWLDLGRRCYEVGRMFYRQGYQTQHIDSTHLFKSRHESGSKYHDAAYKHRSKIFRPLTRMASRSWEADVASALFMNDDYTHVSPRNTTDTDSDKTAAVIKEMMNLRLDKSWYQICIGAAQDTFVNGPAISKVYWQHETTDVVNVEAQTDENGALIGLSSTTTPKVIKDEPRIDMLLPENFIFDPTAAWYDVIGTGKYFIERKMLSVVDVKLKMKRGEWNMITEGEILTCRWALEDDAVKQTKRGDGKPDPINNDNADTDYEVVMVNEVFVCREGVWYVYHMLGTTFMLETPALLEEKYHHGRLPFTYGTAMIESHNNIPDSKTHIGAENQRAVNEISNQRIDNVRLALNKGWIARRGSQLDLQALSRSTPGRIVHTANPQSDLVAMEVSDVTQSSYEETQRLTMEMNEVQGTFSGQAVANNREMNETVGGMKLLSNAATKIVDFDIRTFVMTWVRPTLELFMLNEQYYENDQTIMAIAANNSAYFPRLKVEDLTDDIMTKQLELKVDVGIGATDPVQRVNTLMYGVTQVMSLPGMQDDMDAKAVGSAIFATLGQGDGSKFFPSLAKNFQEPEKAPPPPDPLVLAAQETAKGQVEAANIKAQTDMQKLQMQLEQDKQLALLEMALKAELDGKGNQIDILKTLLQTDAQMKIAGANDTTKRQTTALNAGMQRETAMQQAAQVAQQITPTQQNIDQQAGLND